MNRQLWFVAALVGLSAAWAVPVDAQVVQVWNNTGVGDYNDDNNWDDFAPLAAGDEIGVINNGGTAFLDAEPLLGAAGGIILGEGASESGTLEIRSGGNLPVEAGPTPADVPGTVIVGQDGEGHLIVQRGGTLTALGLSSGGAPASSITLGQGTSGTAVVGIDGTANLNGTTRVIGANVDFTANGLTLGAQHNLISEITGATHSPLKSSGAANLGGTLTLEFNGHTPGPGDTWTLVDASTINGDFTSISSNVQITEPGFGLFLETVPGGMNGQIAQLSVDARLLLSIDRTTGTATLQNLTASETFDIDGYLITSPGGLLDPGAWNSFEADGQADWVESNPGPTHLGELNLPGSRMLGGGASVDLGEIYAPTQFGAAGDVAFEYHVAGGQTVDGLVEYTGFHNNLVLFVDPETGEGAIQNQSPIDIDIDGYLITSASNALNPDGWESLGDGGLAGWTESNPAPNHIGELNLEGGTMLDGRSDPILLGTLFDLDNPMAEQDLQFEFHLPGGETLMGIVEYGEIPDGGGGPMVLLGDYSGNGLVEQADLDLVLGNWGQSADNLPATWVKDPATGFVDQNELDKVLSNWGASQAGLGAAAAVPEPATCVLLLVAAALASCLRRRG